MLQLKNQTPFKAALAAFPNEDGIDSIYLVVKATFALRVGVDLVEEQAPVCLEDQYWSEPGRSSLKLPSEMHLPKPASDVLFVGHAYAPGGRPVSQLEVSLQVANRRKRLLISGERTWKNGVLTVSPSKPEPFELMPIVYERAYGGIGEPDRKGQVPFEPRNPVGVGFAKGKNKGYLKGTPVPNIEDPDRPMTAPGSRYNPAGFGPIAPMWEPRKSLAGTYDEAWQRNRAPYLPHDFNMRHFNVAHADLICDGHLAGGEPIVLKNLSRETPVIRLNVPSVEIESTFRVAGSSQTVPLHLETIMFMPDDGCYSATWRGGLACDKKLLKVEEVTVKLNGMKA
jgi:hypothetical protein